jgi:hypothetical protein
MTRGSITGQVKALSMIVAMQNFIPDRLATSSEKKSAPATTQPQIYTAAWRRGQEATIIDPQPSSAPAQEEDVPATPASPASPVSAGEAPPDPGPSQPTHANRFSPSEAPEPYVPLFASVPDLRVPFSIKNPFVHPR